VVRGGVFQQFGVAPADASAAFSPFRIYNDELTVLGSMAVLNSYPRAVEMFAAGALHADRMISHAFCLDDYTEALEQFRTGGGRKLQIRPQASQSVTLL
jgi:threonine dehydrogenase-like Zn-dependent dehydrogenase